MVGGGDRIQERYLATSTNYELNANQLTTIIYNNGVVTWCPTTTSLAQSIFARTNNTSVSHCRRRGGGHIPEL